MVGALHLVIPGPLYCEASAKMECVLDFIRNNCNPGSFTALDVKNPRFFEPLPGITAYATVISNKVYYRVASTFESSSIRRALTSRVSFFLAALLGVRVSSHLFGGDGPAACSCNNAN